MVILTTRLTMHLSAWGNWPMYSLHVPICFVVCDQDDAIILLFFVLTLTLNIQNKN